jgi:hypothetical protein
MEDPVNESDFGDGSLMKQGFTFLWMGWQRNVQNGAMRMAHARRCAFVARREVQVGTSVGHPSSKSACQTRQMIAEEKRRRVGLR